MNDFFRDTMRDKLLTLKQRLTKGYILNDTTEIKILEFLVEKAFAIINLDIPYEFIAQVDYKFEQILKEEISIPKFDTQNEP